MRTRLLQNLKWMLMGLVLWAAGGARAHASATVRYLGEDFVALGGVSNGLVAADDAGNLLLSTDGGLGFSVRSQGDVFERPLALASSGNTVVAVGEAGVIQRSTNGGQSWGEAQFPPILGDLQGVATNGSGTWIAVGSEFEKTVILRSTNDGADWSKVGSSVNGVLTSVAFDGSSNTWLAGGRTTDLGGLLWRSTNGGQAWTPVEMGESSGLIEAVAANGAGQFAVVGRDGFFGAVQADGGALKIERDFVSQSLFAVVSDGVGGWIAAGAEGVALRFSVSEQSSSAQVLTRPHPAAAKVTALVEAGESTFLAAGLFGDAMWLEPSLESSLVGNQLELTTRNLIHGRSYRLERSSDLTTWTLVDTKQASTVSLVFNVTVPSDSSAFWRVVMVESN